MIKNLYYFSIVFFFIGNLTIFAGIEVVDNNARKLFFQNIILNKDIIELPVKEIQDDYSTTPTFIEFCMKNKAEEYFKDRYKHCLQIISLEDNIEIRVGYYVMDSDKDASNLIFYWSSSSFVRVSKEQIENPEEIGLTKENTICTSILSNTHPSNTHRLLKFQCNNFAVTICVISKDNIVHDSNKIKSISEQLARIVVERIKTNNEIQVIPIKESTLREIILTQGVIMLPVKEIKNDYSITSPCAESYIENKAKTYFKDHYMYCSQTISLADNIKACVEYYVMNSDKEASDIVRCFSSSIMSQEQMENPEEIGLTKENTIRTSFPSVSHRHLIFQYQNFFVSVSVTSKSNIEMDSNKIKNITDQLAKIVIERIKSNNKKCGDSIGRHNI